MRSDRLRSMHALLLWVGLLVFAVAPAGAETGTDPLPSWNDGVTKKCILDYVARTKPGRADFVAPKDRIATFDNDGTLWIEQPMYTQFVFAIDRGEDAGQPASRVEDQAAVQGSSSTTRKRSRRSARRACSRSWRRPIPA